VTLFVAFVLFSSKSLFALAALRIDQALLGKAIAACGSALDDSG
jgi:hypothetical protein